MTHSDDCFDRDAFYVLETQVLKVVMLSTANLVK